MQGFKILKKSFILLIICPLGELRGGGGVTGAGGFYSQHDSKSTSGLASVLSLLKRGLNFNMGKKINFRLVWILVYTIIYFFQYLKHK